jgi:hypothetical protein
MEELQSEMLDLIELALFTRRGANRQQYGTEVARLISRIEEIGDPTLETPLFRNITNQSQRAQLVRNIRQFVANFERIVEINPNLLDS